MTVNLPKLDKKKSHPDKAILNLAIGFKKKFIDHSKSEG